MLDKPCHDVVRMGWGVGGKDSGLGVKLASIEKVQERDDVWC